jgi:hypothetical protein
LLAERAGNTADINCNQSDRIPGKQFRFADFGYYRHVPMFAAGRQKLFPWDGSLRSALFPRKEFLAACLQRWICEDRVLLDRTVCAPRDLNFHISTAQQLCLSKRIARINRQTGTAVYARRVQNPIRI